MKRIIMMLALTALLVAALSMSALSALAASPSQEQCEASGGTFDRNGGEVSCTTTGKNEKQPKFNSTTTSNGTLNNRPQKTEDPCDPCPPGQYK